VTIVEVAPDGAENVVWNFWKMSRHRAENYLKKFREEKARRVQPGGRPIPHVPHNVVGKPEGLSGSQVESSSLKNNVAQEEQEREREEQKPVNTDDTDILSTHDALMAGLRSGTVSLAEYKEAFEATLERMEEIEDAFSAMTKEAIFKRMGLHFRMVNRNEKKGELAKLAADDVLNDFTIGRGLSISFATDFRAASRRALASLVESTTEADLQDFSAKVAKAAAERKQAAEDRKAAIADPQTLDDYNALLRSKGKPFKEAYLDLTSEQQAAYDRLAAEKTRKGRGKPPEQVGSAAKTTTGEIIETKHTKTGEPLFVVQAGERVEREVYNQWNATARKLGGWYSSYRAGGAVPGFQFKTNESAEAFREYLSGETGAAQQLAQDRRDAFLDDRSQSAVERLNEMAERLDENAGAVLSADRKTNTARRAAMASRAEAAANADKALAQTMRNIAAAIEDGSASMLDRVRAKTQVELLSSLTNLARDAELRQKYATAEEREKHRGGRVTADTAAYAEFPRYEAFRSDLAELARKLSDNDGTKKIGQELLKVADDVTDAYLKFAKENTTKVSHFMRGDALAEFASREDAERALKKAGLTGKAIVLPIKRGQNRIVLSPSEAIARGLWDGDSDKRLALSAGLAAELIEAVGRRTKGVEVPWQLQTAHERVQALKRIGIETPAELRAALREFIALREGVKEPDKIKQLEREMVGRQKDGLDFFPTPASVADQLVETAAVEPGMSVLEPSAGMGHIAERIREAGVEPDVIELSGKRRELLEAKGFNIVGSDFVETQPVAGYDRIIMNPPFSDRRDAEHVRHAYDILKPGGRLVAIMGEGVFFGQDKKAQAFRDWLDEVGGTSEKLEEGTFLDPSLPVNTSVSARMVVIDKVAALYSRTEEENPVVELTGAELDGSFEAARDYFRQHLQGQTVHRAEIGNIRVTGKGWHKAKRGLKTDTLKAKLFPAIQPIIEHGTYHGRETVEGRADDIVAFHYFDGSVLIGGDAVQVGVTVAEDSRGNLFYNLNHDADRLWQKSKKARHELRLEARGGKPSADDDSSPSKYSIATGYQPVNLAVLSRGGMGGSTNNTTANVTAEARSFLGRGFDGLVKEFRGHHIYL